MANINRKLSEETGELIEALNVEEPGMRRRETEMAEERGRKGGMREESPAAMQEGCEGLDLNRKQSIDDLSCGRIKKL